MTRGPNGDVACPYCGRPLHWIARRWFGRGCFECERCGEFPDLGNTGPRERHTPAPPARANAARPPKRDDRPRVLLVDDAAEHCDLYALMLEPTAAVLTASRAEDALAIASTEPLDAIVLDVLMPGMDGWETCARLKANPATSAIPVIMLTSLDDPDVPARAQRAGAVATLMKPCPVERLAYAIAAAVRRPG
jgi:CheY-like chemotaxis protein